MVGNAPTTHCLFNALKPVFSGLLLNSAKRGHMRRTANVVLAATLGADTTSPC